MNKKQWDKLPIGTVVMWIGDSYESIEMKKSANSFIILWSNDFNENGEISKFNEADLPYFIISPKWIQELFEVI